MKNQNVYLTLDIGASSGRLFAVIKEESKIHIDEISRFENKTYESNGGLYWDFGHLMFEITNALKKGIEQYPHAKSIGIDTWGVDYGYIDDQGKLIKNPRCYRDGRGIKSKIAFEQVYSNLELYNQTGIQPLPFNTVYQLYDDFINDQDTVNKAKWILLMPDLIAYHLTGEVSTEITNASTTSLYSHKKQDWLGLKEEFYKTSHKFPNLVKPGILKGHLKASFGLKQLPIISVCSHDTASAYISVKQKDNQALINSGTWSLVGKIIKQPIINQTVLEYGFTNETGMFHHVRFLKNIMGLWIINQIKADLEKHQEKHSFFKLEKKAISAEPFQYFIDPDDNIFLEPGHMINKINMFYEKTNQKQTNDIGVILRSVYESLAFKYRLTIERLELITMSHIDDIMIIGGGNQSDLLNQFTANLTNRKIIIGPTEATILGNALVQMYYFKDIKTIKSGQNLIENSFEQIVYEPDYCNEYEKAYDRFKSIIGNEDYHG